MAELRMPDINSVIIVGNLIKDPIFRHTTTGTPVTNFYIASNRKFKDNTGNWKEDVCFVGVVAWYKLAESCYENLRKGSAVLVEGELQSHTRRSEDGFNRNMVEIKARRIQFLNKREIPIGEFYSDKTAPAPQETYGEQPLEFEENAMDEIEEKSAEEPQPKPSEPDTNDYDFGYKDLKL
jgi:single-strand DNA-binding protein